MDRKLLRLSATLLLCATLLRLTANHLPVLTASVPVQERLVALVLFLQTGRAICLPEPEEKCLSQKPVQTPDQRTWLPSAGVEPVFLAENTPEAVAINNQTGYALDVPALLRQPLDWQLRGEAPTVLILHTHATESYVNNEGYRQDTPYRTTDEDYNMISVGSRLAALLEAGGISVIHDKTLYDYPSYSGSYAGAREALQAQLQQNPSIALVLDLHRDAMTDAAGEQLGYRLQTRKGTAAKLMLVVGSDAGGLQYPNWQENLSLGVKLQAALEQDCPGICRPLSVRTGRYNQDLFAQMLLIEMGAAGNTRQEALVSAEYLAQAILSAAAGIRYE